MVVVQNIILLEYGIQIVVLQGIYCTTLNYCNIIWGNSSNYNVSRITKVQKRACKIILGNGYTDFEGAKSVLNVLII